MSAHHRTTNEFDPNAIHRHEYSPSDPVQCLYHVYDNLSQTPYVPGVGIEAGDVNAYMMNPQQIITYASIANHLNWKNRKPTPFISLYDNSQTAMREARRRRSQLHVPAQEVQRNRSSVRIAKVSIRELHRLNVFYFSRDELIQMLQVPTTNPVFYKSMPGEWFVVGYIPDSAVMRST